MRKTILSLLIFGLFIGVNITRSENIDRITAVVDDQIILYSEFLSQFQLLAAQGAYRGYTQAELTSARKDLLEKMVEDKLILIIAREDTTIAITSSEIKDALEEHIRTVRSRFPSQESFLAQLVEEGLTLKDIRQRYRDEVKNQLLKERLLGKQLNSTTANNQEVKSFFEQFRDSLPLRPPSIKLAHILLYIKPGDITLEEKRAVTESLHVQILSGADFAQLAKEYSDDPTAANGGDLGFFKRGDMVPEFERAAYSLAPGQVSGVIQTAYGFHIIKCEERDGGRIRCRHILSSAIASAADSAAVMARADSIYERIVTGMQFEQAAKEYSEDEDSRIFGGELGWYAQEELSPEFKSAITDAEAGSIIPPSVSPSGIHIIKVIDRQPERNVSLELDRDDLKEMAKREKANRKLQEMIREARKIYHVDVRDISG